MQDHTTSMRTDMCGQLTAADAGRTVSVCGWVDRRREHGEHLAFIDLRDRTGVVQCVINSSHDLRSEYVVKMTGEVRLRPDDTANRDLATGEIEIEVVEIEVLAEAEPPPFPLDERTEVDETIRLRHRYVDLRKQRMQNNLRTRAAVNSAVRRGMEEQGFVEVETPMLIASTPEGARDFVVPSRKEPGSFYALPQSPQLFKQLCMVGGVDRYYQIARCLRDEDLRADRQPEFTQVDCEMSFVEQEDILNTFEGLVRHLFQTVLDQEIGDFPRMTYDEAMEKYGIDKPDLRFGMEFRDMAPVTQGVGFNVFDSGEAVLGIVVPGAAEYTRKQLDGLTDWVKRPQIGARGLVYCKINEDGSFKSSVDKFYDQDALAKWAAHTGAGKGDLILVLCGDLNATRKQLAELRLHMGSELGLRDPFDFKPLWVVDFPLLEWDEETERYHAMHHPFTSPKPEHMDLIDSDPGAVRANAYDMVINGVEIGGGSIRIHDKAIQARMFDLLGFTPEEAEAQFGFLMNAFRYGAPPHGGLALGFDRLCSLLGGVNTIRDFIAFPKNNQGRDVMIDAPSAIHQEQYDELFLASTASDKE